MKRRGKIIVSVLLAAMLLAVVAPVGVALADEDQPQAPPGVERQKEITACVAEILGIEQSALENAIKQAQQEQWQKALENRLNQMVEKGIITKEQAQALLNWYKSRPDIPGLRGMFGLGPPRLWAMRPGIGDRQDETLARVAELLGIDKQKLVDAFKQARQEQQEKALDEWLNKLVEKGVISEEQAKAYRDWVKSRPEGIPGLLCPGLAPGRFGKHMLPWGPGRQGNPDNNQGTGTGAKNLNKPPATW